MAGPKLTYIPDILEEHFEELEFLWGQRQAALDSPDYSLKSFHRLEERISAHLDALVASGDRAAPFLERGIGEKSATIVFATAITALRQGSAAWADRLFSEFDQAKDGRLAGLAMAFAHGPAEVVVGRLQQSFAKAPAAVGAAAARALAQHNRLPAGEDRLVELLTADDATVRATGWRAIGLVPPPPPRVRVLPEEVYRAGAGDKDASVRRAALEAAAWVREPWLPEHCRRSAARPGPASWEEIRLLAVLGGEVDLEVLLSVGAAAPLGPSRFRALASYGHPGMVQTLLGGLGDPDPATAASAGAAFTKITGVDVESTRRVEIPPADGKPPDAFEKEFLDEVKLPDPAKAQKAWDRLRATMAKGTRWCRGFDVSRGVPADARPTIDMESLREAALRAAFRGEAGPSARDLEAFPRPAA